MNTPENDARVNSCTLTARSVDVSKTSLDRNGNGSVNDKVMRNDAGVDASVDVDDGDGHNAHTCDSKC